MDATEDAVYIYNITATDVDAGDVLTITGATLPVWLTLTDNGNGTAVLTGTPLNEHVGDHNVIINVSDGTTGADQAFTLSVANTNDAPSFTSEAVTGATEDAVYTYNIIAADVDAGASLAITGATLPAWLVLTDGIINRNTPK